MGDIVLEADVDGDIQFDGTAWHLNLLGKTCDLDMDSTQAGTVLWFLNNGGLQFLVGEIAPDIIEKAFDERERKNGNK